MLPPHSLAGFVAAAVVLATASAGAQEAAPSEPPSPQATESRQSQSASPPPATTHADQTDRAKQINPARDRHAEMRALEQAIDADRQRLIALITKRAGVSPTLHDDPQLIEIAERLPRMEEELRQLREMGEQESVPAKGARP